MDRAGGKRKAEGSNQNQKKRKLGSGKKWQTPHQKAKADKAAAYGSKVDAGDVGIWLTCMKGKEGKATIEARSLFEEYAEKLYGIREALSDAEDEGDDAGDDIEAQIEKEITAASRERQSQKQRVFTAVRVEIACVLFFRVSDPIQPVELVTSICNDAAAGVSRKHRFLNRLTPVQLMGKATEKGLDDLARAVLAKHFCLKSDDDSTEDVENNATYAIRPSIRNHTTLSRDFVIKSIAFLIKTERHKVQLTQPDKIILVEIFQQVCGISVVDGPEYTALKRFNLDEIYVSTNPRNSAKESRTGDANTTHPAAPQS